MTRIAIQDCLKVVENRFALVLLSSVRTRQIMKGSKILVDELKDNEQIIALREIAAGKVRFSSLIGDTIEAENKK